VSRPDPITEMARRLAATHPDANAKTLARRLVAESNGALTIEQARSRIRRQFGVHGSQSRKRTKSVAPRAPRQPGKVYAMPQSIAEPWTPHRIDVLGPVGILSDIHVPYHSEVAVLAAVEHLKAEGIKALLLNGDIADFYAISRYMKDPTKRDFKGELEAVREFLGWLRHEFPDVPIVLKAGNHEERWNHWLWQHGPEISDDRLMSLHSWLKLPGGRAARVNVARGAFLRTLSTVLVGHSHRTSNHAEADMWHHETACWSTGCLCDLRPDYARINRWNWGFAVATIHKRGAFDVQNYRVMGDGTVRSA